MIVRMLKANFLCLIACVSATFGQDKFDREEYADLTSRLRRNSEDEAFWTKVFSENNTNLLRSEFISHLSYDGGYAISHHLHYDKFISSGLLNVLADLAASDLERCRNLLTKLSASPKRNDDMLSAGTNVLRRYWGWFDQIAQRPEIDGPLLQKLLKQAGKDPVTGSEYPKDSIGYEVIFRALARNPGTPVDFLEVLSREESPGIRAELAMNPNLPESILNRLIDESKQMLDGRRQLPEGQSIWLTAQAKEILERAYQTLASKTTAKETLIELATNTRREVRTAVAYNTNTPLEVLSRLATDPEVAVRRAASNTQSRISGVKR
jgi:hypothetical protein